MENLRKFVDDLSPAFKSPESALAKVGNTQRFGRVLATGKRNRGDTVVSGGSSTSFADSELMETSPSTHAKLGGILGDEATIPQSSKPGKSHPYSHWKLSPESSAAYNILSAFSFLPRHAETRCTSQDTPSLSHEVEPTDKGVLVINDDADDAMQSHDPLMAPRVAVHCISDHCENCPTVRLLSDGPECRISDGNRLVEVGTYVVKPGHICTCEEDARKKQQQPRRSSFEPIRLAWRKVSLGIHNSNTKQRSASEDFSPATSLRRPSAFRRTSVERNHSVVNESSTRNTKTKQRSASEDHGAKNASTTRRSGMFFRMSLAFKTKRERSEDDEGVRGIGDANARAEEKK